MSGTAKVLGVVLILATAISTQAAGSASASVGGHFYSGASHALLSGTESSGHRVKFAFDGSTPIECESVSYSGTFGGTWTQSLVLTPTYHWCRTEGGSGFEVGIAAGCNYVLWSSTSPFLHGTFSIACNKETTIKISHPNCSIVLPPQALSGAYYTAVTENGKEALTVDVTVNGITAHYESGICIFLGTKHSGTMTGSFTLSSVDSKGNPVDLGVT